MNRVLEKLAKLWQFLRDAVAVLRPCRFSALVVAAGAALMLSGQGLEFTVRLPSESFGKAVWFDVCVFFWAFQSWYWARLVLDLTFGDRNAPLAHPRAGRLKAIIIQAPRLLAAGSYLVAVGVCFRAGTWLIGVILLAEGVLFYAFLVLRTSLVNTYARDASGWTRAFLVRREGDPRSLRSLPLLSVIILGSTLVCAACLTVWACVDAVGFGWTFGASAVAFLGFSMLVPGGSLLVFWSSVGGRTRLGESPGAFPDTRGGYPVLSLLLLVAVAFSFFPAQDNHAIRTLEQAGPGSPPAKLDQAFERWQGQAAKLPDGRSNLVVVAAAGGGLRAAFWTATVLGAIQDRSGSFSRQLFAVSGVSGGSLGAAVFVTLASGQVSLSDRRANCGEGDRRTGRIECAAQAMLSQDFLAPPVAALLFPDLMQRFIPFGFLPDRARALEQSWELAWRRAGFADDVWAERGFRTLWPGDRFVPALLLNGTHVESGKRVIASNLDIAAEPKVFRDAFDLYALLPPGSEIRPSTAAHTSARFTYVSPAGTLADGTHLVDGGYFENFGAITAREVLKAAIDRRGKTIRPVAILISNDPELGERDLSSSEPQPPHPVARETWASEALSPIRALLHTRDARGLLAASELRALAEQSGGKYFQFRLCKEVGHRDPALGWVLNAESEDLMRAQLRSNACGNAEQLRSLLETLRGG